VSYNLNPKLSSQDSDGEISSVLIREFVKDSLLLEITTTATAKSQLTIPIESRFYRIFPLYVAWLEDEKPALLVKDELVNSLQLADWLADEDYVDYVVQKIFDCWTNIMSISSSIPSYSTLCSFEHHISCYLSTWLLTRSSWSHGLTDTTMRLLL